MVKQIGEGIPVCDIIFDNPPALRYISHLMKLASFSRPKPRQLPKIVWLFGESGTGKTRTAWNVLTQAYLFTESNKSSTQWWEGYRGEKNVIIDEFKGNYPLTQLLQVLDPQPCRVFVKGSSAVLCAENFIITSNLAPETFYCEESNLNALFRRLNEYGRQFKYIFTGGDGDREPRVCERRLYELGNENLLTVGETEIKIKEFFA